MWIKDVDGDLINIAMMESLQINGGEVIAFTVRPNTPTGYTLFKGDDGECEEHLNKLASQLCGTPDTATTPLLDESDLHRMQNAIHDLRDDDSHGTANGLEDLMIRLRDVKVTAQRPEAHTPCL